MGEIVNVVESRSSRPGIVRFETNRVLSGMSHERYEAGTPVEGNRPVDEIARRILATGQAASVHINGGVITVDLAKGMDGDGIAEVIRGLFTFYGDDDAIPVPGVSEG